MDFGVLTPNVNQIIKYPYQKVNKGDLGFFSVPIVQNSTPFTRLTTDSYWRCINIVIRCQSIQIWLQYATSWQ